MSRLVFYRSPLVEGDPALFAYRLRPTRTRIGRVDDCDVVLPDDEVSRSHCLIDHRDGAFELIDRSSNGTFRNDERVQRCVLAHGDRVRVGPFVALVDLEDRASAAPPTETAQPERRHEELVETGEQLAVSEAHVVVTSGPGEGRRYRLRGARVSVGGFGSRVALPDPALVRDHVFVRLVHGRAMIEPGAGAVFLGPVRLRDITPVYPGEELRVGNTELGIEWLTREDAPEADTFGEMVGRSATMRKAFGMLRRIAAHHAPVLLIGESGTGKELAARAIHEASPRAGRPFVAINCGAITGTLFESELFGHEKGAFTGADAKRDGAFQRANGGTLFLDEIGELPEEAQSKLLRALESGEVRRVGGSEPTFPDVRVVAATNRNLADEAKGGRFRSDLYFRLAVLAVRLPALRERMEDLPALVEAIGRKIHPDVHVTPDAMEALRGYTWPGNARELRNVLTRAFVLEGPHIQGGAIVFNPLDGDSSTPARNTIDEAERDVVMEAMKRAGGNRTQAARTLGIARSTLIYKLRRWGEG
jgi:transcriptional regulator with AAA-type ATPase domain/pSer/pThr/pTyr-binding forkhead associated (FHA) protein